MKKVVVVILKILAWLSGVAVLLAAALLVLAMLFEKFLEGSCSDEYAYGVSSPDGKRFASVRLSDCGATTSVSSEVFISTTASKEKSNKAAYFYGATTSTGYGIHLCWEDDSTLVVSYSRINHYYIYAPHPGESPHGVTILVRPDSDLQAGVCK